MSGATFFLILLIPRLFYSKKFNGVAEAGILKPTNMALSYGEKSTHQSISLFHAHCGHTSISESATPQSLVESSFTKSVVKENVQECVQKYIFEESTYTLVSENMDQLVFGDDECGTACDKVVI